MKRLLFILTITAIIVLAIKMNASYAYYNGIMVRQCSIDMINYPELICD